jgi:hypothetical protein
MESVGYIDYGTMKLQGITSQNDDIPLLAAMKIQVKAHKRILVYLQQHASATAVGV